MNTEEFDKNIEFIKAEISKHSNNHELLNNLMELMKSKLKHDETIHKNELEKTIKLAEIDERHKSTIHTNNTQLNMNVNDNLSATQQNYNTNYANMHQSYYNNHFNSFNQFLLNGPQLLNSLNTFTPTPQYQTYNNDLPKITNGNN